MRTPSGASGPCSPRTPASTAGSSPPCVTTGIYCRPSCPAVPPKPENMRFYPSAAAAQQAGFRACKRCRPDASPGSPEWNVRADLVARAMRLIADGVVDRDGRPRPGRPARLQRPAAPAPAARRARRRPAGAGPRAAGADGAAADRDDGAADGRRRLRRRVRQRPAVQRHRPRRSSPCRRPSCGGGPRRRAGRRPAARPGRRRAGAAAAVPRAAAARTTCSGTSRRRRCRAWRSGATAPTGAPCGCRTALASWRCAPRPDHVACQLALADLRDLATAISRCRRLLDLDADPVAVDDVLGADPVLAPLVRRRPAAGCRAPSTRAEFAVRAVLGQQVSTAAARTHAGRLVAAHGEPVEDPAAA